MVEDKQGNGNEYRSTTLSTHPVDVAATHLADCVATMVTLVAETAMMRSLARGMMVQGGVPGKVLDYMVYKPWDVAGYGILARAIAVGEWGGMWVLFQATYGISTFVGRRWFGYL